MDKRLNPNYQINQRIKASIFDAACLALLFFLINLLGSFLVTHVSSSYVDAYETTNKHIEYSNLCKIDEKNGYLQYESSDLVKTENDNLVFCNVLSYYYLNYLSNSNIKEGSKGSEEIINHDIKWFNETILEIGNKDIFKTKSDTSDSISIEIGVFNDAYLNSHSQDDVHDFVIDKYNEAVKDFYNLSFMKDASNVMAVCNGIVFSLSAFIPLIVFYFVVPLFSKYKQTIGKRIFKVVIVRNNKIISHWILLLRDLPAILVCILIGFVNISSWQIGIPVGAILVSSGIMIFTKKNYAVHDFVAGTRVITLDNYLELEKEKENADKQDNQN